MITMKECSKSAIKQIEFCQFSIQTMKPFFNYCFFKLNWLTDWHRVHIILGSFSSLWITLSLADPHNNKICKAWHNSYTGCLLTSVPEVLSNISLVFWARDLESYMKVLYYMAFDNQIMIWPLSPTRYFKWLCQKIQRFQKG